MRLVAEDRYKFGIVESHRRVPELAHLPKLARWLRLARA
jgi:hypothetical protein